MAWFFFLSHITNKCVSCLNLNLTYSPAHDQNIWIQTSDKPLFNLEDLLGLHLKAPRIYTFMQRGAHLQSCMWHAGSRSSTLKEFDAGDARQETRRIKQIKRGGEEEGEKLFNAKPLKIKKRNKTSPDTGSILYPSNLLCSQLPAPAIWGGATGGHIGAIFAPMAPFLAPAFKVLHCDVHGLDVCLVPYMQSYHYPCLLTIAGPVFVTSAALCLGLWHDCTVDLFSFTYRSLCLSLSLCFASAQNVYHVWLWLWFDDLENLLPLSLCDTSAALISSAVSQITHAVLGRKKINKKLKNKKV